MLIQLKLIRAALKSEAGEYTWAKEVHGTLMLTKRTMPDGTPIFGLVLIGPESQVIPVLNNVDPRYFKEVIW